MIGQIKVILGCNIDVHGKDQKVEHLLENYMTIMEGSALELGLSEL